MNIVILIILAIAIAILSWPSIRANGLAYRARRERYFASQKNTAVSQTIVNRGNIQSQTNVAHNQTIIQNNTIKNKIAPANTEALPIDVNALIEKARREAPLTSAIGKQNMTPTHDDNYQGLSETSKTAENDVSDKGRDKQIIRQVSPASSTMKPNDVIISRVIRKKVLDKYDQVIALRHETPSYIARKVFNITGGGSRLQYIAAITEVLNTDANNRALEGE